MNRHEVFGLDQTEHEFLLLLTTVSRGVDIVDFAVDNFDASFWDNINQLVDASRISRDPVQLEIDKHAIPCDKEGHGKII